MENACACLPLLEQIMDVGVRVFFYLEDRERMLDTAMDKVMLSLTGFAAEMEREKASPRTYDAMLRKAKALHVTGSKVYGYGTLRYWGQTERASCTGARSPGTGYLAAIVDALDDVTLNAVLYSLGSLGNVRTETLRAFTREETNAALAKMA